MVKLRDGCLTAKHDRRRGRPGGDRTSRLVEELVTIANRRGFLGANEARTRKIGAELDLIVGIHAMREAHEAVAARVDRGLARELDVGWDDIGGWLG